MENTYGNTNPYTVKIPSNNRPPINNPSVSVPVEIGSAGVKNPFVIPGLKKLTLSHNSIQTIILKILLKVTVIG